jgi:ABC-type uncharacterized transport system substrate-binding protein
MLRIVRVVSSLILFAPSALVAQRGASRPGEAVHQIGFLALRPMPELLPNLAEFREGMRELGHTEGKDYVIVVRTANDTASRYPALVAELSQLGAELIVAASTPAAVAIHATNPTMPIVVGRGPDLVGAKLAESAEHPGGVATGIEELAPGMSDKRLRLLKQAVPALRQVAILSAAPTASGHALQYNEVERAAKVLGVTLRTYSVTAASDFDRTFREIAQDGADGLIVFNGLLPRPIQKRVVELAAQHRLAAIYPDRSYVDDGGLMSYGQRGPEMFRLAASYVHQILKGAKPGDLPLKSTRLYLSVNTSSAESMRLVLPASILSLADDIVK